MRKINKSLYGILILILGVAAAAMIFLPALIYRDSNASFTGLQAIFGTEFADLGIFGSGVLEPNILGMVAFALPLIAGLIAVLFEKGAIVSLLLFIAGGVLLFTLPTYQVASVTILGNRTVLDVTWTLGYGVVIAACASAGGALVSLLKLVSRPE